VPASFRVICRVHPKLACACCDAIVQAPAKSRPVDRRIAAPGLLTHVLEAKFADHLSLYRQSIIYVHEGVNLDHALLASWVGAASALLSPLVDAITACAGGIEPACRRYAYPGTSSVSVRSAPN
jgi:transposase